MCLSQKQMKFILLGCIHKQSSCSSYPKIRFEKATTHFCKGHCNLTQCQQQVPLSEQAYAADDKLSALASGFYLQSKWLVWFKKALSCNQASAFFFKTVGTRSHKQKSTLTQTLIANGFVLELFHPAVNAQYLLYLTFKCKRICFNWINCVQQVENSKTMQTS